MGSILNSQCPWYYIYGYIHKTKTIYWWNKFVILNHLILEYMFPVYILSFSELFKLSQMILFFIRLNLILLYLLNIQILCHRKWGFIFLILDSYTKNILLFLTLLLIIVGNTLPSRLMIYYNFSKLF